uniref:Uncharacterized protein n=1 Tax=Podoviridae sp. ctlpi2 TaxID=2826574 RepID=A0A8S5MLI8_9CAUD|nr:MAG TPA: hypothetical protein [Podoviridae sp. ctlpi2]
MTYQIVRMPTDKDELTEKLTEYTPFLDAMYTEQDIKLFGEVNFILDHWLFLWDTGAGFFLEKRGDDGRLLVLAMLTQFRDLWHARPRMEVHRMVLSGADNLDDEAEVNGVIEYLKSVASLMRFDLLYYTSRDDKGNELKELVWNGRA